MLNMRLANSKIAIGASFKTVDEVVILFEEPMPAKFTWTIYHAQSPTMRHLVDTIFDETTKTW